MRTMISAVLRSIAITLVAAGFTGVAVAHPAPFSFLDIYLDAGGASGALVVHDYDVGHEFGLSRPELLLDAAVAKEYRGRLAGLMDSRLRIDADARRAALRWGDRIEVLPERQGLRLPFALDGGPRGALKIETA